MFNTHLMVSTVYTDYIHQYLWDCVNQIVLQLVVKISAKVNAKYFCKSFCGIVKISKHEM